jgi:DNA repair protein RecN (Recombination protein N)
MLNRLVIQNYAIIPKLDMAISPGLTIITGETGAGKSILLGALGLALGKRADSKVLLNEEKKCVVEAHFQLPDDTLAALFQQEGLDYDRQLICRREIVAGGRSRSFINDTPVSLKQLADITDQLIELHHQHDHLALQSRENQIRLLDTISNATTAFHAYQKAYDELNEIRHALEKARASEASSARKKDFLHFQINELEQAKLQQGETAELESAQNMLEHAEAIAHVLGQMQYVLTDGQHSMGNQLTQLTKQMEGVRKIYEPMTEIAERIDALRVEIQDLSLEVSRLDGPGTNDPGKLSRIQTRLSQLYALFKKYQCVDESQLLSLQNNLKEEWNSLTSISDQIQALEEKVLVCTSALQQAGETLTTKRKTGAKKLIPQVEKLLHELGMPNARFSIEISPLATPSPLGLDDINYMFTANKGASMQPIQAVASGGELSRLSLAIKSIYAQQAALPTIIFDEIDTGISGEVAWRMGQLIRVLAKGHQILMITHSPQIAAHAEMQFHVSKDSHQERDTSTIQLLSKDQRVLEIAKMVSGDPPSKAAIQNAESLIASVKNQR